MYKTDFNWSVEKASVQAFAVLYPFWQPVPVVNVIRMIKYIMGIIFVSSVKKWTFG